jgi:hypothetical protein
MQLADVLDEHQAFGRRHQRQQRREQRRLTGPGPTGDQEAARTRPGRAARPPSRGEGCRRRRVRRGRAAGRSIRRLRCVPRATRVGRRRASGPRPGAARRPRAGSRRVLLPAAAARRTASARTPASPPRSTPDRSGSAPAVDPDPSAPLTRTSVTAGRPTNVCSGPSSRAGPAGEVTEHPFLSRSRADASSRVVRLARGPRGRMAAHPRGPAPPRAPAPAAGRPPTAAREPPRGLGRQARRGGPADHDREVAGEPFELRDRPHRGGGPPHVGADDTTPSGRREHGSSGVVQPARESATTRSPSSAALSRIRVHGGRRDTRDVGTVPGEQTDAAGGWSGGPDGTAGSRRRVPQVLPAQAGGASAPKRRSTPPPSGSRSSSVTARSRRAAVSASAAESVVAPAPPHPPTTATTGAPSRRAHRTRDPGGEPGLGVRQDGDRLGAQPDRVPPHLRIGLAGAHEHEAHPGAVTATSVDGSSGHCATTSAASPGAVPGPGSATTGAPPAARTRRASVPTGSGACAITRTSCGIASPPRCTRTDRHERARRIGSETARLAGCGRRDGRSRPVDDGPRLRTARRKRQARQATTPAGGERGSSTSPARGGGAGSGARLSPASQVCTSGDADATGEGL